MTVMCDPELKVIDPFEAPYLFYSKPENELMSLVAQRTGHRLRGSLVATVRNAYDAACLIAEHGYDVGLAHHIEEMLRKSGDYSSWKRAMPNKTPPAIRIYKKQYDKRIDAEVTNEIDACGASIPVGQYLFHGGHWPASMMTMDTKRPLSSSFLPEVAFQNAIHNGKSYHSRRIDLWVMHFLEPGIKAYVFNGRGALANEKEVLLAAGIRLTLTSHKRIKADYPVGLDETTTMNVPVNVLNVEVSRISE